MRHLGMSWRTMSALDIEAIEGIAGTVHRDFYEAPEVLIEKRNLYPNGAHVLEIEERAVGYVLSHPFTSRSIPALNTLLGALPPNPDTYYIHDLALLPVARRMGAAEFIVNVLAKHAGARSFGSVSLVAVNGSQGFWARQRFAAIDLPDLVAKLSAYEPDARYMVRELG